MVKLKIAAKLKAQCSFVVFQERKRVCKSKDLHR